jgi:hypothetical protein
MCSPISTKTPSLSLFKPKSRQKELASGPIATAALALLTVGLALKARYHPLPLISLIEKAIVLFPLSRQEALFRAHFQETLSPIPCMNVFKRHVFNVSRSIEEERKLYQTAEQSRGDETVVYLMPRLARGAITHLPGQHERIIEWAKGKKLVVKRVKEQREACQLLSCQKNVSLLWVTTHGNAFRIGFNPYEKWREDYFDLSTVQSAFSERAKIVLESCNTGKEENGFCIARKIQKQVGKQIIVFAPKKNVGMHYHLLEGIAYPHTKIDKQGNVTFTVQGKDVTAQFPVDLVDRPEPSTSSDALQHKS